jgi:hypothetical protein
LSEVLALARERGRGSERRADAGTPNDTEQCANDELTNEASDGHARKQLIAGVAQGAGHAGEEALQFRHEQDKPERGEYHGADGAKCIWVETERCAQGGEKDSDQREG